MRRRGRTRHEELEAAARGSCGDRSLGGDSGLRPPIGADRLRPVWMPPQKHDRELSLRYRHKLAMIFDDVMPESGRNPCPACSLRRGLESVTLDRLATVAWTLRPSPGFLPACPTAPSASCPPGRPARAQRPTSRSRRPSPLPRLWSRPGPLCCLLALPRRSSSCCVVSFLSRTQPTSAYGRSLASRDV